MYQKHQCKKKQTVVMHKLDTYTYIPWNNGTSNKTKENTLLIKFTFSLYPLENSYLYDCLSVKEKPFFGIFTREI